MFSDDVAYFLEIRKTNDIAKSPDCLIFLSSIQKLMRVIKANDSHQTAIFVVLEPETLDRNGDIVAVDTITEACHEFTMNLANKAVNLNHTDGTDTSEAWYVENYILPMNLE